MAISTEIGSIAEIVGDRKAVEITAKAGFDAWDFSLEGMCNVDWKRRTLLPNDHPLAGPHYLAYARELKQIGLDNGIHCHQSHAPVPCTVSGVRDYLKRAIECTAEAGGSICVIHPNTDVGPEENGRMYAELLPFAKAHGVKIATENMWDWDNELDQSKFCSCATGDSFNAHLDAAMDDSFIACLDIGHAEMRGSGEGAARMIRALGSRLQALHIHDNDRWHDSHKLPFTMDIDFDAVIEALREIGYKGYISLEACEHLRGFTPEEVPAGVAEMAACARRLEKMLQTG